MCVQCCYSALRNGKLVGGGGCWHEWYRLDAGLKIKSLIRSLMWEITEVGLRKNCQWNVLSLKTWVGIWKAKASPKSKRIHTYVCQAHTNITLAAQAYQSHWQVSGVKCQRVWHWSRRSVSCTHSHVHTTGAPRCLLTHIWTGGNSICVHSLWGRSRKGELGGPFHLSWSLRPCGTYIWGQDRKTSECTVAEVEGSGGLDEGAWSPVCVCACFFSVLLMHPKWLTTLAGLWSVMKGLVLRISCCHFLWMQTLSCTFIFEKKKNRALLLHEKNGLYCPRTGFGPIETHLNLSWPYLPPFILVMWMTLRACVWLFPL